mmetsp:Transcript_6889/g.14947  ORF Transcript_6889/g.14947 Transcript_6889/m.14947 type:complete len:98 (+) Transcript_6889:112-405(+)
MTLRSDMDVLTRLLLSVNNKLYPDNILFMCAFSIHISPRHCLFLPLRLYAVMLPLHHMITFTTPSSLLMLHIIISLYKLSPHHHNLLPPTVRDLDLH